MWADLVGISLSYAPIKLSIFLSATRARENSATSASEVLGELRSIIEDGAMKKVGQNIKYDWIVLKRYGIQLQGIDGDTMIAFLPPQSHQTQPQPE